MRRTELPNLAVMAAGLPPLDAEEGEFMPDKGQQDTGTRLGSTELLKRGISRSRGLHHRYERRAA